MKVDKELLQCKEVWNKKKIIRNIYQGWYKEIIKWLKKGKTLEVAAGIGNFKEFYPNIISSDIRINPWIDKIVDATKIEFKDESLDNIVCIDGLHHFSDPYKFLSEAERVLKKRGRLILFEPNISIFSYLVRKLLHHESISNKLTTSKNALDANFAMANLIFQKNIKEINRRFPNFRILKKEKKEFFLYPLSRGIHTKKSFIPYSLYGFLRKIENLLLLLPIKNIVCFKMLIVLEKN